MRLMQGDRQGALADIERAMSMATAARGKAGFSAHLGYAALAKGNVHRAMGQPKEAAKSWRLAVLNLKHTLGCDPSGHAASTTIARWAVVRLKSRAR